MPALTMRGKLKAARTMRIERRVLANDVYDVLKGMIFDQVLPPDSRVSIDVLALELDVSQTPVREALARLEGDGLVTKKAHGRYWTTPTLTADAFEQLYNLRLVLEPFAAGEAARRIKRNDLDMLTSSLDAMEASGTGGEYYQYGAFAGHDACFHQTIASASGNQFVADAILRMHSHLQLARLYRNFGIVDAAEALVDHREILTTLEHHDSQAATDGMRHHIDRSRSRLRLLLKERAEPVKITPSPASRPNGGWP